MTKVYSNAGSRLFYSEWSPQPVTSASNSTSSISIKSPDSNKQKSSKARSNNGSEKPISLWSNAVYGLIIGILCGVIILATVITLWLTTPSTAVSDPTTTTTSTTTTTTSLLGFSCGYSCVGQTWASAIDILAQWSYDATVNENTNNYLTSTSKTPTYVTGYVNNALSLSASLNPTLSTSYIPLFNTSFTIDAWVYPSAYPNAKDHFIAAMCPSTNNDSCLYMSIRKNYTNFYFYFGFYNDDLWGITSIPTNSWTHVAFVFDNYLLQQTIYVNGSSDTSQNTVSYLRATSGNFTIGYNSMASLANDSFTGYIDQLTVSNRAKSSCEILEEATVLAWFTFDNGVEPLMDMGPYSISARASAYTIISGRSSSQAISFSGNTNSYFQASGFTALSISNSPFSISLWVYPQSLAGTLIHISNVSNGTGWCYPFIGLVANASVVAQVFDGSIQSLVGVNISLNTWSHIVQTWSPTNGLILYVNYWNTVQANWVTSFHASGTLPMYVTLASMYHGAGFCSSGMINSNASFEGAIDDFRVYNRELSSADVCNIFYT